MSRDGIEDVGHVIGPPGPAVSPLSDTAPRGLRRQRQATEVPRGEPSTDVIVDRGSSECETERFGAGIEKLDLKPSVHDGLRLADQLIHPLLAERAIAVPVNVGAMR